MTRRASGTDNRRYHKTRPGSTPETRENQLIALAINRAEQQLLDGTASSQIICHYLKLGSTRERLEKEILEKQRDLYGAKTEAIIAEKRNEQLYSEVLEAMRSYSGKPSDAGDDYEYEEY